MMNPDPIPSASRNGPRPTPVWQRVAVPGLLLVHGLLCWLARPAGFLTGQDDVEYAVLGESLRQAGYNILFRVDQPLHAQYPPGYPAMLALWGWFSGDSFDSLALLSVLLSVAVLALAYVAARRVFGNHIAIGTLAILAVNPALVGAGGNVASETPFAMLFILALLLLLSEDKAARYVAWAGVAAILAALTRSVGVVLIGAIGLHWLIGRRWKALTVFGATALVTVGGWFYWTIVSPERLVSSSYVGDLQRTVNNAVVNVGFFRVLLRRIAYYTTEGIPHVLAVPSISGTPLDNAAATLALIVGMGAGLWLLLRKWRPAAITLLLYGGLLSTWAWHNARFLTPLIPVLVPTLLAGWVVLLGRTSPGWARGVILTAVILLVGGGTMRTGAQIASRISCHDWQDFPPASCLTEDQASFFEALRHVADNTPPDDVFLVAKSGALWHYTGHRSVSYNAAIHQAAETIVPYLREQNVKWLLIADLEQSEPRRMARLVAPNCRMFRLERHFPERTYLFELLDGPADPRTRDACEAMGAEQAALATSTAP